jgi:hypothetical protein
VPIQRLNPSILDGATTDGLAANMPNWAPRINVPPFNACFTTTGVTFTFGGPAYGKLDTRKNLAAFLDL